MLNLFGIKVWVWLGVIGILALSTWLILKNKKKSVQEPMAISVKPNSVKTATIYNFNTTTCGWSKKFQPEWDKFTELAKSDPTLANVIVKDVKCDDNSNAEMCGNPKYNIPGFPYVLLEMDDKIIPFDGERTANSLASFCNTHLS